VSVLSFVGAASLLLAACATQGAADSAQGTADNDVPEGATDGLASRLCTLGDRLEYRLFPGLDHNNLVAGSLSLVGSWITARLDNHVASTTCKTNP